MKNWLLKLGQPTTEILGSRADNSSVAAGRDIINSTIQIGLDAGGVARILEQQLDARLSEIAILKGVPVAPLRAVLKKLGESRVAVAEIPTRLANAADELIQLRASLARQRNDPPEFSAIRAQASSLIASGEFDAARAALNEGRLAARELRQQLSRSEAEFLYEEARVHSLQRNFDAGCIKLTEAVNLDPDNFAISLSLASCCREQGSFAKAEEAYRSAIATAVRNGDAPSHFIGLQQLGETQSERGDFAAALESYRAILATADRFVLDNPSDQPWQRRLSAALIFVGEALEAQGDMVAAQESYGGALATAKRLAKAVPHDHRAQRRVYIAYQKIGNLLLTIRDLDSALVNFTLAHEIANKIIQIESGDKLFDTLLHSERASLLEDIGGALVAKGELSAALNSYNESKLIYERCAKTYPGGDIWDSGLSYTLRKMGDALRAQGDLTAALGSYRASHAISARLAKSDPGNADRHTELQWVTSGIANLAHFFILERNFAKALEVSEFAISLFPARLGWHANRAHALMFLGRIEEARTIYLQYRGQNVRDDKLWETIVSNDFAEWRTVALTDPLMDEIDKLFVSAE